MQYAQTIRPNLGLIPDRSGGVPVEHRAPITIRRVTADGYVVDRFTYEDVARETQEHAFRVGRLDYLYEAPQVVELGWHHRLRDAERRITEHRAATSRRERRAQ